MSTSEMASDQSHALADLSLQGNEVRITNAIPATVNDHKALLYLRVPAHADRNRYLERHLEQIHWAKAECARLATPRAIYRTVPVEEIGTDGVSLQGGYRLKGEQITHLLAGAERIVFAIATLGPAIDDEVERLLREKMYVEWYTLNAVGAAMINEYAYQVASALRRQAAAEGWQTTPPLGPGFKYWALEDQRVVFSVLPAHRIGVELTENCIMIPYKTKSMAIGIGHQLPRRAAKEWAPNPDDPDDDWRR